MARLLTVLAAILVVCSVAGGGQNPDIRIFLEQADGTNYAEPGFAANFSVYVCLDSFGSGGGARGTALRLNRTFDAVKVAQVVVPPGGVGLGDVEVDGWSLTWPDCAYPDGDGIVVVGRVDYVYIGGQGVIEVVEHPTEGRPVVDCNFEMDDWCVRYSQSGHFGVWETPPKGDCPDDVTTWYVDVDDPSGIDEGTLEYPYNAIQDAIDVASEGDTVLVAPGSYFGERNRDLDFSGTNISVIGTPAGWDSVVIACGLGTRDPHRGFIFQSGEDGTSLISDLVVRGGYANRGGGVLCTNGSSPRIEDCLFSECVAAVGGAICFSSSGGAISDCKFGECSATRGGAVFCEASSPEFDGCDFVHNSADSIGGAFWCDEASSPALIQVGFFSNSAGTSGGAVFCEADASMRSCWFEANSVVSVGGTGGAIACGPSFIGPSIETCAFIENSAWRGGGLYTEDSPADIQLSFFSGNLDGGAIACVGDPGPILDHVTIRGNGAGEYASGVTTWSYPVEISHCVIAFGIGGPAVYRVGGATPTLTCCDLYGNEGGDWVGAIAGQYGTSGNICEDPLFCGDIANVEHGSPCAARNNPECGVIGAAGASCYGELPWIYSIADVPDDQGGQLRLKWDRSRYDAEDDTVTVTGYAVYRRQDRAGGGGAPGPAPVDPSNTGPAGRRLDGWDCVAYVPARTDTVYQCVVPTLCDSTAGGGICWSIYMVSGTTADPWIYFDSVPDSGYSVDNTAPGVPAGFALEYHAPGGNQLSWEACGDEDFQYFRVYRSIDPEFAPGPVSFVHATTETEWLDPDGTGWDYYKLTALDHAGNESEAASPGEITDVPDVAIPLVYAVHQSAPNPSGPGVMIRYDVPAPGGEVAIGIFDVSGRHVRTLVSGVERPGRRVVSWDGRDDHGHPVGSGVYYYRLEADGFRATRKMMFLR